MKPKSLLLQALLLLGFAAGAVAEVRSSAGGAVKVKSESLLPSAGRATNPSGSVGNFGVFQPFGRAATSPDGRVALNGAVPATLFQEAPGATANLTLSQTFVQENRPSGEVVGQLVGAQSKDKIAEQLDRALEA